MLDWDLRICNRIIENRIEDIGQHERASREKYRTYHIRKFAVREIVGNIRVMVSEN